MNLIRVTAAACLAVVTLTACGAEISGTAVAGQTPPTTAAPADDESEEEPADPPAEVTDRPEPTQSTDTEVATSEQPPVRPVDPADLDDAAVDWLRTFCGGFTDLNAFISPDTTGMTDEETIAAVVDAYTAMAQIGADTATAMNELPVPDFTDGDRINLAVITWFHTVDAVYGVGAELIADGRFADAAELTATIDGIEAGLDDVNSDLFEALSMMDEPTTEMLRTLPECAVLTG